MPILDHLGLAVDAPEPVAALFETLIDERPYKQETVPHQGVRTHFIATETAKLELLESLDATSPIARFLERRGEGLHHIAFEVRDIDAAMAHCRAHDFTPLSETPQPGADDKQIFFLHPRDTHGLLIEFCQSVPASLTPTVIPHRTGRLALYTAGAPDAPPLLLLHGAAGCTLLETAALLRRLEPYYRVLAVDFSGHGASEDGSAFSVDVFADNARAVLDYADIGRTDVFGFSMGGYVALHLAHRHPDRVRRLAVHGTAIEWGEARVEAMHRRLNADAIEARHPQRAEQLAALHTNWKHLFRRMQAFVAELPDRSPRMVEAASTLSHSTLVSAVDQDDLFPLDAPLGLHGVLPHSRLALLPGRRHALQNVNLDTLAPVLRQHLDH